MVESTKTARSSTLKAKREAQILGAAFQEFAANGYAAARLDDVARRAKTAKGTIFLYFPDKKSLFRAVLRNSIHPLPSNSPLLGPSPRSDTAIRHLLSPLYSELVENRKARALLRLLIAESEKFPELAEIYYQEIIAPGASSLKAAIEAGVASGEFQATCASRFPQLVVAPAILAAIWTLLLGKRHQLDLSAYRDAHLDFVMKSLCSEFPAIAADREEKLPEVQS